MAEEVARSPGKGGRAGSTGGQLPEGSPEGTSLSPTHPKAHLFYEPRRMPPSLLLFPPCEFPPGEMIPRKSTGGNPPKPFFSCTPVFKDFAISLRVVGASEHQANCLSPGKTQEAFPVGLRPTVHPAGHAGCGKGRTVVGAGELE